MEDAAKSGSNDGGESKAAAAELPAPAGWKKMKLTPQKGGTPKKNDIIFIAPTGEELNNKSQLEKYLKSHPGGPHVSDFDWGSGETPRRSARISQKAKAVTPLDPEPKKKRSRKSSTPKKDEKETESKEQIKNMDVQMHDTKVDSETNKVAVEEEQDGKSAQLPEDIELNKENADIEPESEEQIKNTDVQMQGTQVDSEAIKVPAEKYQVGKSAELPEDIELNKENADIETESEEQIKNTDVQMQGAQVDSETIKVPAAEDQVGKSAELPEGIERNKENADIETDSTLEEIRGNDVLMQDTGITSMDEVEHKKDASEKVQDDNVSEIQKVTESNKRDNAGLETGPVPDRISDNDVDMQETDIIIKADAETKKVPAGKAQDDKLTEVPEETEPTKAVDVDVEASSVVTVTGDIFAKTETHVTEEVQTVEELGGTVPVNSVIAIEELRGKTGASEVPQKTKESHDKNEVQIPEQQGVEIGTEPMKTVDAGVEASSIVSVTGDIFAKTETHDATEEETQSVKAVEVSGGTVLMNDTIAIEGETGASEVPQKTEVNEESHDKDEVKIPEQQGVENGTEEAAIDTGNEVFSDSKDRYIAVDGHPSAVVDTFKLARDENNIQIEEQALKENESTESNSSKGEELGAQQLGRIDAQPPSAPSVSC